MSSCSKEEVQQMKTDLNEVCRSLNVTIVPKDFQIEFFCKAVKGIDGFLLVEVICSLLVGNNVIQIRPRAEVENLFCTNCFLLC